MDMNVCFRVCEDTYFHSLCSYLLRTLNNSQPASETKFPPEEELPGASSCALQHQGACTGAMATPRQHHPATQQKKPLAARQSHSIIARRYANRPPASNREGKYFSSRSWEPS